MTEKEMRRLRRADLLEMLLALRKENEQLRQQLEQATNELENRRIQVDSSGSLAEAALRLNGVFEAAQAACVQYTENVRQRLEQQELETKNKCEAMIARAKQEAEAFSWLKDLVDGNDTKKG